MKQYHRISSNNLWTSKFSPY